MARHDALHSIIRSKFGLSRIRTLRDNLPISVKRAGRDMLGQVFCEAGMNRGAEIGVKRGEYSKVLCQANPNIELYCIDLWGPSSVRDERYSDRHARYYRIAQDILKDYNATLIKKSSMEALADFEDGSLDFVYIDAAHDFDHVCPDIIFWSRKVRSGGIIGCHDYYAFGHAGVMAAVDAYTKCHHIDPWYVTYEMMPTAFWVKP